MFISSTTYKYTAIRLEQLALLKFHRFGVHGLSGHQFKVMKTIKTTKDEEGKDVYVLTLVIKHYEADGLVNTRVLTLAVSQEEDVEIGELSSEFLA